MKDSAKKKIAKRGTTPKAIAAAWKSGGKRKAMDLAIYNRKESNLTNLARELFRLLTLESNREAKKLALAFSGGGERQGWGRPRRQSAKEKMRFLAHWKSCKEKELLVKIETGVVWYGETFLADLEQEFNRVCREDAKAGLFQKPGAIKSEADNPNWFRQILMANEGLVNILSWNQQAKKLVAHKPQPLSSVASAIGIQPQNFRREARKFGIKPGKPGRPTGT